MAHAIDLHPPQSKTALLAKQGRPEAIDRWIGNGRKTWPVVEDVSTFAVTWKRWWNSLQPESRVQRRSTFVNVVGENETWEALKKGGMNGFFNIVVSLAWWYKALKTSAQRKTFMEMVNDVLWVEDQIIKTIEGSKKRTRGDADDEVEGAKVKR
jgi:hypothetical protein